MTEEKAKNNNHSLGHEIGLGIALVRSLLLLVMGLSLLIIPEKTHGTLFNMMGLFWLTTGLVLIRRKVHDRESRLLLLAAILAVAAGVLVLTRNLSRQWLPEAWIAGLLGAVILLTGILHATTQLRLGRQALRGRPIVNILLGIAEIVLGALLLFDPSGQRQSVYNVAVVWALLGGGLVLISTVRQWLQERRQEQPKQASKQSEQAEKLQGEQPDQTEEQPGEQA
jgi:uncharacterized membrane protein HdeD (DUF308 family)